MGEQPNRTIFVSYSRKDAHWLKRLRVHLAPLRREHRIDIWDDSRIAAGQQWRAEIQRAIESSGVAILLISADFLASDFITTRELPRLLSASRRSRLRIIPVIISPCRFSEDPFFFGLQAANNPERPLSQLRRPEQEAVFVQIVRQVETVFQQADTPLQRVPFPATKAPRSTPPPQLAESTTNPEHKVQTDKSNGTRFVEQELPVLVDRLARRGQVFSMIFIDVDDLTQINKRFSREVGDAVLDAVSEQIRRRSAARYKGRCGDDTFYAVLFDVVRAEDFCHRLKDDIGAYDWWRLAPGLRVTCTLGYARLRSGEDPTQFIIRSIYGLLDGKKGGGNVVNEGPRFLPTTSPQPLPSSFQRVEYHTPFGMAAGREFKPFSLRDYFS